MDPRALPSQGRGPVARFDSLSRGEVLSSRSSAAGSRRCSTSLAGAYARALEEGAEDVAGEVFAGIEFVLVVAVLVKGAYVDAVGVVSAEEVRNLCCDVSGVLDAEEREEVALKGRAPVLGGVRGDRRPERELDRERELLRRRDLRRRRRPGLVRLVSRRTERFGTNSRAHSGAPVPRLLPKGFVEKMDLAEGAQHRPVAAVGTPATEIVLPTS